MKVAELFEQGPGQWGLRGDPYLWQEMQERLMDIEVPQTAEELKTLLEDTYEEVTGYSISHEQIFVIERFKHGGMSSGGISPSFWINRGIPLLVERHQAAV